MQTTLDFPNYRCKIIQLAEPKQHPNADKLQIFTIDYVNHVITDLINYKQGDYVLYFPTECAINKEFISYINGFEDNSRNLDINQKGFFNKHARVRAIKLRGEISSGYIVSLALFKFWLLTKNITFLVSADMLNTEFDTIANIVICEKYIPANTLNLGGKVVQQKTEKRNKLVDVLVDKQFNLYKETEHFNKTLNAFDIATTPVVITQKMHGSSFIASHVLLKRSLNFMERFLLKWFNIEIPQTEYGYIWSSGKPKSGLPKGTSKGYKSNTGNYYSEDIWKFEFDKIKDVIPKGYSIYGEVVGHNIQGKYTYGIPFLERSRLYVYQITITNTDGVVNVLDWESLKQFCKTYNLNYVAELDSNITLNKYGQTPEQIIENLSNTYLEKTLPDGLPDEGVCIQNTITKKWYKLKSKSFILGETKSLDTN